ncbi:MAG: hypothetical protein ACKVT2_11945 [Saprospiraceae bacterium]
MSKKLFFIPALFIGAFLMFTASSCGDDCKFEQKDFVGQYVATEDCSLSPAASYNVTISADGETNVKITGFWELFSNSVNASLDCGTITIASQDPDSDGYVVEGSGFIEKNDGNITINFSYTVTNTNVTPVAVDNCSSTVYVKL